METVNTEKVNGKNIDFILLVDDDADDNDLHCGTITKSGVAQKVECFMHALDAITYFKNCLTEEPVDKYPVPSLVFFDYKMPFYNGFELLDEFKALRDPFLRKKQIKFVLLTGVVDPAVTLRANTDYKEWIIAVIQKPLQTEVLANLLEKHFKDYPYSASAGKK